MSKKSLVEREKKRQRLVEKYADKRAELKERIRTSTSPRERFELQRELQRLPRSSSRTRLHNRCKITGRGRGYYRDFGLSRNVFREWAHKGYLPGVVKSSW